MRGIHYLICSLMEAYSLTHVSKPGRWHSL